MKARTLVSLSGTAAVVALAVLLFAPHGASALDMFAQIQDDAHNCTGLSQVQNFQGAIIVRGVSEVLSRAFDARTGDVTRVRAPVGPITIVKDFDGCTPFFFQSLVIGQNLARVLISFVTTGTQPTVVFTIQMDDVFVVSQKITGDATAAQSPMEQVSFVYSVLTLTDFPQNSNGSTGPPISVRCDFGRQACL